MKYRIKTKKGYILDVDDLGRVNTCVNDNNSKCYNYREGVDAILKIVDWRYGIKLEEYKPIRELQKPDGLFVICENNTYFISVGELTVSFSEDISNAKLMNFDEAIKAYGEIARRDKLFDGEIFPVEKCS